METVKYSKVSSYMLGPPEGFTNTLALRSMEVLSAVNATSGYPSIYYEQLG